MSLFNRDRRMTHEEWSAWLAKPDQQLTREEFDSLELSLLHALVADIHAGLGLNPTRTGGNLDQATRLLDRLVRYVGGSRPATQSRPPVMADRSDIQGSLPSPGAGRE